MQTTGKNVLKVERIVQNLKKNAENLRQCVEMLKKARKSAKN